jgi:hypothetical protein
LLNISGSLPQSKKRKLPSEGVPTKISRPGVSFADSDSKLAKIQLYSAATVKEDQILKSQKFGIHWGASTKNKSPDSPTDVSNRLPLRSTALKTSQSRDEVENVPNKDEPPIVEEAC